jgi:hypothetical protein
MRRAPLDRLGRRVRSVLAIQSRHSARESLVRQRFPVVLAARLSRPVRLRRDFPAVPAALRIQSHPEAPVTLADPEALVAPEVLQFHY